MKTFNAGNSGSFTKALELARAEFVRLIAEGQKKVYLIVSDNPETEGYRVETEKPVLGEEEYIFERYPETTPFAFRLISTVNILDY